MALVLPAVHVKNSNRSVIIFWGFAAPFSPTCRFLICIGAIILHVAIYSSQGPYFGLHVLCRGVF